MKLWEVLATGSLIAVAAAAVGTGTLSVRWGDDDTKLIAALPKSQHTLEAAIAQAAKAPETAISAKFELEDKGDLSLSVYTAEKGLGVDAEHNILKEISGSPESATWKTETEVFKDVEHVSRASEQLTIMALSKMSLTDVIKKAEKDQSGTIYSVTPKMRDRKAVFVVLVAPKDKPVELVYDAMTGNPIAPARR